MANFTIVPNTTAACHSQIGCINDMCQLSKNNKVKLICFTPSGEFDYGGDLTISVLCTIIMVLTIYSVFITLYSVYLRKN